MLQKRGCHGYSALNGLHTKHFLKMQINKRTLFFSSMFIKYSEKYTQSNFGGLNFLQIKSQFYNKGDVFKYFILLPSIMSLFQLLTGFFP